MNSGSVITVAAQGSARFLYISGAKRKEWVRPKTLFTAKKVISNTAVISGNKQRSWSWTFRDLNECLEPDFRPPDLKHQISSIHQEEDSLCTSIASYLAVLPWQAGAHWQSIVKDIIMNPLLSPDKSPIIDFRPLLLGRMWSCHLRPISQSVDFLVHVTAQHWPVNGFSTRVQNVGRPVNNMTAWWPYFLFLFIYFFSGRYNNTITHSGFLFVSLGIILTFKDILLGKKCIKCAKMQQKKGYKAVMRMKL